MFKKRILCKKSKNRYCPFSKTQNLADTNNSFSITFTTKSSLELVRSRFSNELKKKRDFPFSNSFNDI